MTPQFRKIIYNLKKKWKIYIETFKGKEIGGYRIYDRDCRFQLDLWKKNNTYDLVINLKRFHGSCYYDKNIYDLIHRHFKKKMI